MQAQATEALRLQQAAAQEMAQAQQAQMAALRQQNEELKSAMVEQYARVVRDQEMMQQNMQQGIEGVRDSLQTPEVRAPRV